MKKALFMVMIFCMGMVTLFLSTGFAADLKPYILGFSPEVTGRRAELGIAGKRGAMIALEKINVAGGVNGRKLKAVFYDGQSKPVVNVKNTKKLINVDKAIACMGYTSVGGTLASAQTAADGETLLFSGGPALVTGGKTRPWLFTVVPDQRIASVPLLIQNLLDRGAKKIAYIHVNTAYGKLGTGAFKATCKKLDITPAIMEEYSPQAVDLTTQISHIKAAGADGLLITGNLADSVKVIKTARDLGFNHPIVCDYAIVGPEFIKLGGDLVEGIVSTSLKALVAKDLPDNDRQKKVAMELYQDYTKQFKTFSLYPGHTWDQVMLIAKALEKVSPKLDPAKAADLKLIRSQLREGLENIQGFVGQNGIFNYAPTDHIGLAPGCYVKVVVKNGQWRLYDK
jgi:branched-chain amino acid transport system substrate-binding protein